MMKYLLKVSVTFVLVLIITPGYSQSLQPSTLFSNNMVLQQGMDVPVWGTAAPNEKITVSFANQIKTTTANNEGKWMLKLSPLKATKIPTDMVISGSTEVKISNIVVGEVWICSGQSNMQFNVNQVPEIKALIPFANNIRSFEVKRTVSYNEEENAIGKWKTTHPSSAVAFGFAYFLESIGDVPVGIIHASWGSSSIEAWMPKDMGNNLPYFKTIMNDFDADIKTRKKIEEITS
ncbi:sialate O-acetylesterase, partial [Seonamhaeicola sp.]|uniref:sialate O-acetylesterase n=1 Tax=Seonamhaeicola sp. TaxID=1912245 RepID=UPI0035670AE2